MIRLLLHLLGKNGFEDCKSCETLKQQLEFAQSEKKELLDTLLKIVKPTIVEAPVQVVAPTTQVGGVFSRRRAALENADRESARIQRESKILGRPDGVKVSDLKMEIGPALAFQSTESLESELKIFGQAEEEK